MTKTELVNAIAERTGISQKAAAEMLAAALDVIQAEVAHGEKVILPGFGIFEAVHKPERDARNPATGQTIRVAESWAPKFRPGAGFKGLVNEGARQAVSA